MFTLAQVGGALLIFTLCPLAGALPLTGWLVRGLVGDRFSIGMTRRLGVVAAQVYGGAIARNLALVIELSKGIGAVLLARYFFPGDDTWGVIALIALVMGRYWSAKAPGTSSLIGGILVLDPITTALTTLLSLLGFTVVREKHPGRILVLIVFTCLTALRHPQGFRILLTGCLAGLVGWIYQRFPADLEISSTDTPVDSEGVFGLFRRDRALLSLEKIHTPDQVGSKIAILTQLTAWGYPVPKGYGLLPGDDPTFLLELTRPSSEAPVIVRLSPVEDRPLLATSAGQYPALADITAQDTLFAAINQGFRRYEHPDAVRYRRDLGLPETHLAILVQQQIDCLWGGIAFSRHPFTGEGNTVFIEAGQGHPEAVVNGHIAPARYQVAIQPTDLPERAEEPESWHLPQALSLAITPTAYSLAGLPLRLLEQVAFLTRHVEQRYRNLPQAVEWGFDGDRLWILQCRPLPQWQPTPRPLQSQLPGSETAPAISAPTWSGLPVSPGITHGELIRWQPGQPLPTLSADVILQVPFLNPLKISLWAQAGGLIAETGGQLSHGAIIAREYGIPTLILNPSNSPAIPERYSLWIDGTLGIIKQIQ
jgi:pyruvate,water dikinase